MLSHSKLIAFAATTNPELARGFYEGLLGLELLEDTPFALVFDANGTSLRIQKVEVVESPGYTILGWEVEDIARSVRDFRAMGVSFEKFPGLEQDDQGVWQSPGGAKVAWFRDPDGNVLSLTEFETS